MGRHPDRQRGQSRQPRYLRDGSNPDAGVLVIADLFGWTFPNVRLLADHYAREANVTVYVPDFFGGEVLPFEPIAQGRFHEIDLGGFMKRNGRQQREPKIFAIALELRGQFKKAAAVGFCYGGWAVFRLAACEHQPPLVDAIATGHPSLVVPKDMDEISVPVQILAPEIDQQYTPELRSTPFRFCRRQRSLLVSSSFRASSMPFSSVVIPTNPGRGKGWSGGRMPLLLG